MPFLPELNRGLQTYSRVEGVSRDDLNHQIAEFRRERKKRPSARVLEAIDKIAHVSVNGFFDGLTKVRSHTPRAVPLFPWEKWYFEEYKDAGDPKKRKTWKDLQSREIDGMQMYVVYLQNKYVVPETMLLSLSDQATTRDTRDSFRSINKSTQKYLRRWVSDELPTALSDASAKGILSVVLQNPALSTELLLGGATASLIYSDQLAKRGTLTNNINRMHIEFGLALKAHFLSHQRSLADFREFSAGEIDAMSQRIFLGSRYQIESMEDKRQAKAIAAGVGIAQVAQALSTGSWPRILENLIVPAGASALLLRKLRRERSGKSVVAYIQEQAELLAIADQESRSISSQRGRGISFDLASSGLTHMREDLTEKLADSGRRVQTALTETPWMLALAAQSAQSAEHRLFGEEMAPIAQSLIAAGILTYALTPLKEEYTRQRNAEVKNQELAKLAHYIQAINISEHRVPAYVDFAPFQTEYPVSTEELLKRMHGPLVIHQVGVGAVDRVVSVHQPLVLEPGVHFVKAPSGRRKSEFLRLLSLEQGDITKTHIMKGIDLRVIPPEQLSNVVYHVEAVPPQSNLTIAEQMLPFIKDREPNLFNTAIMRLTTSQLGGEREAVRRIAQTLAQRDDLLQSWIENPLGETGNKDSMIASTILTECFYQILKPWYQDIESPQQAAEYLKRKPGATQGTSTGEAARFELLKAFLKKRAVILLDEPTGNLDGSDQGNIYDYIRGYKMDYSDITSLSLAVSAIGEYMRQNPETVIIVASNDPRLQNRLHTSDRRILGTQIVPIKRNAREVTWYQTELTNGGNSELLRNV